MSDEQTYQSNSGCLGWLLLAIAGVAMFLALPGDYTSTKSESKNRSGVLSGNQTELMSRNQVNIASTVTNCYGDFSCLTVITSTTSTVSTSSTDMSLEGDRNVIQQTSGGLECYDPALQRYTPEACQARGILP